MKIGLKSQEVQEIGNKITVFDWKEKNVVLFWFEGWATFNN